MGRAEEDRLEPHLLKKCCCSPMFLKVSRDIEDRRKIKTVQKDEARGKKEKRKMEEESQVKMMEKKGKGKGKQKA